MLGMKIIYHQASLLNLIGNSMTTGLTSKRCHKKQEKKKKKKKRNIRNQGVHVIFVQQVY